MNENLVEQVARELDAMRREIANAHKRDKQRFRSELRRSLKRTYRPRVEGTKKERTIRIYVKKTRATREQKKVSALTERQLRLGAEILARMENNT